MSAGPPRLAAWLLSRLVGAAEREPVLGDLEERWRARRSRSGAWSAAVWYWVRALSIPSRLALSGSAVAAGAVRRELSTVLRGHARAPLGALAMVGTLALGIGAITAVLSVVDAVLLEPLPYPEAERLVTIGHRASGAGLDELPNSSAAHVVYEAGSTTFASMALYDTGESTVTEAGAEPVRVRAVWATRTLLTVLGLAPALGRPFTAEEDAPGGPRAVLLTDRFWRSRYAADPSVVGRTLEIEGIAREVVGVLPPAFGFPSPDVAVVHPMRLDRADLGGFNTPGIGRLHTGVTPAAAEAELTRLLPRITSVVDFMTPAMLDDAGIRPVVRPYADTVVGDVRAPLWIVLATMAFVLLIACTNVAHLFLVRAESRRQELAVRAAMGAGRAHLLGLFLAEAAVLAAAGGVLGVALAYALLRALRGLGPAGLPRLESVAIDGSVLLAVVALTGGIALAFGALSLRAAAGDGVAALRGSVRGATADRSAGRVRQILMASQVAFAAVLLVGAGLTVRSFERLRAVDAGFRSDGVLTFGIALPLASYPDAEAVATFHRTFLERIETVPGTEVAGLTARLPLSGFSTALDPLSVRGRPSAPDAIPPVAEMRLASPGYFEALGIPIVRGRLLDWRDVDTRSGAVLVSERVARTFFAGEDAVGQAVAHGIRGLPGERPWSDVVGVVGDVRGVSPFEEPMGAVYYPMLTGEGVDMDWLARTVSYVVRAERDPAALTPAIRRELAALDPRLPMADVRPLDDVVAASRARLTFATLLLASAALLGLVLGAIGLYGVTSIAAGLRTREIGVRIALGATPGAVRRMVVRQGVGAAAAGLALGLLAAAGLARFLRSLLFQVQGTDAVTYLTVAAVLLGVALLATWIPAARAAKLDPRTTLDAG